MVSRTPNVRSPLLRGVLLPLLLVAAVPGGAWAADGGLGAGDWVKTLAGFDPENLAAPLRLLAMVTVFSVVPSVLLLATCFPRLLIVLSFLRRALGTQDLPPNQVVVGLAFVLTAMIMLPVFKEIHSEAYEPLVAGELSGVDVALDRASGSLKGFMFNHTREQDLALFLETVGDLDDADSVSATAGSSYDLASELTVEDLDFFVVLPAFVLSELKTAFQMGFLIYLPFLVIDLAVSAVLISMGMFMLPPILISLPLKVLVFVLVDGWTLVVRELIEGFAA
jgi:flagellar biosynthetic protein FliP